MQLKQNTKHSSEKWYTTVFWFAAVVSNQSQCKTYIFKLPAAVGSF